MNRHPQYFPDFVILYFWLFVYIKGQLSDYSDRKSLVKEITAKKIHSKLIIRLNTSSFYLILRTL